MNGIQEGRPVGDDDDAHVEHGHRDDREHSHPELRVVAEEVPDQERHALLLRAPPERACAGGAARARSRLVPADASASASLPSYARETTRTAAKRQQDGGEERDGKADRGQGALSEPEDGGSPGARRKEENGGQGEPQRSRRRRGPAGRWRSPHTRAMKITNWTQEATSRTLL